MFAVCLSKLRSHQNRVQAVAAQNLGGTTGRNNLEAQRLQHLRVDDDVTLVVVSHRNEDLTGSRHRRTCAGLSLRERGVEVLVQAHDLTGRAHFGAQQRIDHHALRSAEAGKRQNRSLHSNRGLLRQGCAIHVLRQVALSLQLGDGLAQANQHCGLSQLHAGSLRHERNGTGCARVSLNHVQVLGNVGELNVNQAAHAGAASNLLGSVLHLRHDVRAEGNRGQGAGGVTGVNTGFLNVLHDAAQVQLLAVEESIHVNLDGVLKELVNQSRLRGRNLSSVLQVAGQVSLVVDDLHAAATQHVRGANQNRVTNLVGDALSSLEGERGAVLGRNQAALLQHASELAAILSQVDSLGGGAQNRHARILQGTSQLQRSLTAQLHEHTHQAAGTTLGLDDLKHVLKGQRLEVQAGRDVIVGRNGLGVAVDHDSLVTERTQHHGSVHARVVELNTLTDTVRARTQNHNRRLLVRRNLILHIVGGVVVRSERLKFGSTGVHGLEDRADTQSVANTAHNVLRRADNLSNLSVRETVALSQLQGLRVKVVTLSVNHASNLIQQHQLIQEPRVNLGSLVQLLHGSASQQSLLNLVDTLSGRNLCLLNQLSQLSLRQGQRLEREGGALLLERTHGLLQSLGEVTTQGHSLTNTLHGGGQGRVSSRELLKREARNLHNHIVEGRLEGRRGLLGDIVRDLIQGVTQGQLGRNLRNREAGSLRRKCRGTRHARVHLNDDDAAGLRIDRELDVTTTGVHANLTNHVDRNIAQLLELTVSQGQCGCHGDRVTGVHAHGVEVFDGADDHDVVVGVTHHLQLVFLPAEDGLLQQDLASRRVLNTGAGNTVEVFLVVRPYPSRDHPW